MIVEAVLFVVGIGMMAGLFWFLKSHMTREMEGRFARISQEALKSTLDQIAMFERQKFEGELKEANAQLELKKQSIEQSIDGLRQELERYKILMREFEQDRAQKYGNLESQLKNTSQVTNRLQETTNHLTNILGNVKLRGQWGERMAEDIIRSCGLIEGVNYKRQKQLDTAATKPDYTFLLPDEHKINMDVKFPLNNYLQMVNASEEIQREQFKREFLRNVQMRIREIKDRSYINPADNTLDFVLLFIPNEQVFGFIQENSPGILDEALQQKVVLCSPFTLYAMLSVIRQAFENFHYEKATRDIVRMIELFAQTYDKFKVRFDDLGKTIEKVDHQYHELREKSFKNLDVKIRRIEDFKKGNMKASGDETALIDISAQESADEDAV